MKNVLLVYLPFCTPASPPFSLTSIYSFLKANYNGGVSLLDLNLEFHKLKFSSYQRYFQDEKQWANYEEVFSDYFRESSKVYSENNRLVVDGKNPELFDELLNQILDKKPDVVAFSIVYSSQSFYALLILKALKGKIKTVIGGPAINERLSLIADKTLSNDVELLEFISEKKTDSTKLDFNYVTDFNVFKLKEYFTPKPVVPIKTSTSCYYKQCTFCSHHKNVKYVEYPLEIIKNNIKSSKQKYFFLIDEMISVDRLLKFAEIVKDLNIKWACQLKPTKEYTSVVLKKLKDAGLEMAMWGVESGNQRILDLMKKGTNVLDVKTVLKNTHDNGIKTIVYIMFGFPTETKEEFLDTINFLKENSKYIDLVSTTVFGLQSNTKIYEKPGGFGIKNVNEEERIVLEPKITYEITSGLTKEGAMKLRKNYKKTLEKINKYPKGMNYFREHMLISNYN
ncbi:MAG: radical SAM protein [Nanoarchaeota archaeon]|nr:radical SAM protein [Nanoarchaeota archaeon]MBU1269371.1 radical SAM protein [Nanoarchaeota archaeon]MBU1604894.1 radical SAM protein [Nanoarchaeota archaeon]MBU2442685.1 radical SAM protein [Nanoarchaeota archaeon]